MVRVLINLCCCRLGLTNLNALVMIYKNWLEDAKKKDVEEFFLLLKEMFLKSMKKNWTNLVTLRTICCNIFLIDMDLILTCLYNLHFEF
jgi:hypothetical protein